MNVCKISFKNSILAIWNQLTRKGAWRNIFVTHNAFGIFSEYSHISRRSGSLRFLTQIRKLHLGQQKQWERSMVCIFLFTNVHGVTDGI